MWFNYCCFPFWNVCSKFCIYLVWSNIQCADGHACLYVHLGKIANFFCAFYSFEWFWFDEIKEINHKQFSLQRCWFCPFICPFCFKTPLYRPFIGWKGPVLRIRHTEDYIRDPVKMRFLSNLNWKISLSMN